LAGSFHIDSFRLQQSLEVKESLLLTFERDRLNALLVVFSVAGLTADTVPHAFLQRVFEVVRCQLEELKVLAIRACFRLVSTTKRIALCDRRQVSLVIVETGMRCRFYAILVHCKKTCVVGPFAYPLKMGN
jgi:hypothetical protein